MSDPREEHPSLAYHSYIALIARFDHSHTLRLPASDSQGERSRDFLFRENAVPFAQACSGLRRELDEWRMRFPVFKKDGRRRKAQFSPFLFQPLCYGTLGFSDDIGFVLLDNFVAVTRLTAICATMEESDVTLCPKLSSIPQAQECWREELHRAPSVSDTILEMAPHWPFYEFHTLLAPDRAANANSKSGDPPATAPPPIFDDAPLCIVTSFKVNILAGMPHGVRFQQVIYATIIKTITNLTLGLTRGELPLHSPQFEPKDLQSLKCVLLENQSSEDITLLIFANNLCVADLLVMAVRQLTMQDLVEAREEDLRDVILHSDLHRNASGGADGGSAEICDQGWDARIESLRGNHVFMQTFSTIAFDHRVLGGRDTRLKGICEAYLQCDVSPGHELDLDEMLEKARTKTFANRGYSLPLDQRMRIVKDSADSLPGRHDLLVKICPEKHDADPAIVPTSRVFQFLSHFFDELTRAQGERRSAGSGGEMTDESGFLDLSTQLLLRVPKIGHGDKPSEYVPGKKLPRPVEWNEHAHGLDFYRKLRSSVAERFGLEYHEEQAGPGKRLGYDSLCKALRKAGCPPSTMYSLVYMFQEFLECIGDPLRCDAAIDLYDGFALLNRLIGSDGVVFDWLKANPEFRRSANRHYVFEGSIKSLIDAMENAFSLRMQRNATRHDARDIAFMLRSGFGKFVAAMDVPLKCGVGLLRNQYERVDRDHFAAATAVRTCQHASVKYASFCGSGDSSHSTEYHWLSLSMDVFHLIRPEQIYFFFHEMGHKLFQSPGTSNPALQPRLLLPWERDSQAMEVEQNATSRAGEVFADLLAHLLVFADKTELFAPFHAVSFSEDQGSSIKDFHELDDAEAELAYAYVNMEAMFRGFVVTHLIQLAKGGEGRKASLIQLVQCQDPFAGRSDASDDAAVSWRRYCERYGPLYLGLPAFWDPHAAISNQSKLERRFRSFSAALNDPQVLDELTQFWQRAAQIIKKHFAQAADGLDNKDLADLEKTIGKRIRKSLRTGRPVQLAEFDSGLGNHLLPMLVVTQLGRAYIRLTYGSLLPSHRTHILADDNGEGPYNKYLSWAPHAGLFVACPKTRKKRLRAQITCLKTLWDLSTLFRARRIVELTKLSVSEDGG